MHSQDSEHSTVTTEHVEKKTVDNDGEAVRVRLEHKLKQKLHDSLIVDIFKGVIQQEGKGLYTHLLTINRDISEELYSTFYKELVITHRKTLDLLLQTLRCRSRTADLPKTLYIRLGCAGNIASSSQHPACPQESSIPCRLMDKDTCHHLREEDIPKLHQLAELCSRSISTFILHCNRNISSLWRILHHLSFPKVRDVEAPVQVLVTSSYIGPFPCVTRMRLFAISDYTARELIGDHNFQQYRRLEKLLLSFWDVRDETMELILDHLRFPKDIKVVGLERDRGYNFPCSNEYLPSLLPLADRLTIVMSAEGLDSVYNRWQMIIRSDIANRPIWLEEMLDSMFTISSGKRDAIWSEMEAQLMQRNSLVQSLTL